MKEMLEETRKKMKRKKVSNCISFSDFCFYAFVAALLNDTDAPRGKERKREREREGIQGRPRGSSIYQSDFERKFAIDQNDPDCSKHLLFCNRRYAKDSKPEEKFLRVATHTRFCTEFFVGCCEYFQDKRRRRNSALVGFVKIQVLLFDLHISCTLRKKNCL